MKILIAEDDFTSRAILQAILTKWGHEVTSVSDGNEALSVFQQSDAVQLAILDWEMPELDGVALCRKLREQEHKSPLYLILLTSRDGTGDMIQGLEAGADEYIAKPYNNAELRARVNVGCRMIMLQNEMLKQKQLELLNMSLEKRVKEIVAELRQKDQRLLQAQKMEAIGQLAAGIAHEINTPLQFVQNNVTFIERVCRDLQGYLIEIATTESAHCTSRTVTPSEEATLSLFLEEIPESIVETHDGINRIAKIVMAMREFSHPGGKDKIPADLNHALENTLIVCRNEWRHAAEVTTDFEPGLPLINCFSDQLNQVFLNLIIKASHAIEEQQAITCERSGRITITTRQDGDWVEIQVSDTGCGIPEAIQHRIFEPFFTTKEVGKGTGQGLALAYDIIVNKHGGRIECTSEPGQGTAFLIRLPITPPRQS